VLALFWSAQAMLALLLSLSRRLKVWVLINPVLFQTSKKAKVQEWLAQNS
jgi:hypothetical protein